MSKTILFYEVGLGIRGTTQAIFDYAYYNEVILGNRSVIFYCENNETNDSSVIAKFNSTFDHVEVHRSAEDYEARLEAVCNDHNAEACYYLIIGKNSLPLSKSRRNFVHVVFQKYEPHGHVYAYVSEWLAKYRTNGRSPFVPHIVSLPEPLRTLRAEFGIPQDAVVAGRFGGFTTFDLGFVKSEVIEALERHENLYFFFLNTAIFVDHPRAIFAPKMTLPQEKSDYISSCDFMLHGRHRGESFGLAIAEFLFHNKPVLAWGGGSDKNHLTMLRHEEALLYRDGKDLARKLDEWITSGPPKYEYRTMVADFQPQAVMESFDRVFIQNPNTSPLDEITTKAHINWVFVGFIMRRLYSHLFELRSRRGLKG